MRCAAQHAALCAIAASDGTVVHIRCDARGGRHQHNRHHHVPRPEQATLATTAAITAAAAVAGAAAAALVARIIAQAVLPRGLPAVARRLRLALGRLA